MNLNNNTKGIFYERTTKSVKIYFSIKEELTESRSKSRNKLSAPPPSPKVLCEVTICTYIGDRNC